MSLKNFLIIFLVLIIVTCAGFFGFYKTHFSKNTTVVLPQATNIQSVSVKANIQDDSKQAMLDQPGCKAAFSLEVFPNLPTFTFTEELKNEIKHYRQSWQDVCTGKSEKSLYPLWVAAQQLATSFNYFLSDPSVGYSVEYDEKYDVNNDLPELIPGIQSDWAEGSLAAVHISPEFFSENGALGNQEDNYFFKKFSTVFGDDGAPGYEQTWDYGGCTHYGSYNWVGVFAGIDDLLQQIESPKYLEEVNNFRDSIVERINFASDPKILSYMCNGDTKEAAINNLEKVLQYFTQHTAYSKDITALNSALNNLKSL